MWYINRNRFFYRFVTIHACDRWTDRQTEFSSLDRVCILCSAVKKLTVISLTSPFMGVVVKLVLQFYV